MVGKAKHIALSHTDRHPLGLRAARLQPHVCPYVIVHEIQKRLMEGHEARIELTQHLHR